MTSLTRDSSKAVSQKLIELLEEARGPGGAGQSVSFSDRLDALEVEALESCAPGTTLAMIRVAREAVEFAERITTSASRA